MQIVQRGLIFKLCISMLFSVIKTMINIHNVPEHRTCALALNVGVYTFIIIPILKKRAV
jgi:hypothetical protein